MTTPDDLRVTVDDNRIEVLSILQKDMKDNPNNWTVENYMFDENGVLLFALEPRRKRSEIIAYREDIKLGVYLIVDRHTFWFRKGYYSYKIHIMPNAPQQQRFLIEQYASIRPTTELVETLRDLWINFTLMKNLKRMLDWKERLKNANIVV